MMNTCPHSQTQFHQVVLVPSLYTFWSIQLPPIRWISGPLALHSLHGATKDISSLFNLENWISFPELKLDIDFCGMLLAILLRWKSRLHNLVYGDGKESNVEIPSTALLSRLRAENIHCVKKKKKKPLCLIVEKVRKSAPLKYTIPLTLPLLARSYLQNRT